MRRSTHPTMDYLDHLSEFAARIEFGALAPALQEQALWILADTAAARPDARAGAQVRHQRGGR